MLPIVKPKIRMPSQVAAALSMWITTSAAAPCTTSSPIVSQRLSIRSARNQPTTSRATMLPIAVTLSVTVAAESEPSRCSRKAVWCRMKPVCASSTTTKVISTAQKGTVRSAWAMLQRRVCTSALSESLRCCPAAASRPSCGRPISRGSQTSTQATIGSPTIRISAPMIGVASCSPPESISSPLSGESTAPPSETPVEAIAMARARRITNQRASVALTATPAASPEPTASAM